MRGKLLKTGALAPVAAGFAGALAPEAERSSSWATSTGASNSARVIEFRVKISF